MQPAGGGAPGVPLMHTPTNWVPESLEDAPPLAAVLLACDFTEVALTRHVWGIVEDRATHTLRTSASLDAVLLVAPFVPVLSESATEPDTTEPSAGSATLASC